MTKTKTMTNTIRDYLQRAILETVDNVCNLVIKSDTGQHSQVLQCFNNQAMGIVFFLFSFQKSCLLNVFNNQSME